MIDFEPESLKGVYSALFTPYDKNGNVNVGMIEKIVEFHLASGLTGFYVGGSTGESYLLSSDERKQLLESVVTFNRGRGKVIAHVGHISTDEAIALARHAEKCGVDAISAVGPVYFGSTFDHAYRHYSDIAGATGLPFIMYALTIIGGDIVPDVTVKFFDIENVVGMKYTGTDFFLMQCLSHMIDRPHIFFSGSDQLFLGGLCFGTGGSIGTSQNYAPKLFVDVYNLFHEGRIHEACRVQEQINELVSLMVTDEERSYQKAMMRYIGYDCGHFRRPFKQLTEEEYLAYAERVDGLNLLERAAGA